MKRRILAGILVSAFMLSAALALTGCEGKTSPQNLMDGVEANAPSIDGDLQGIGSLRVSDFAVRLLQSTDTGGGNQLISPVSVLSALALVANGAQGETLAQMNQTFGLTTQDLTAYLGHYLRSLPSEEKAKVSVANSIWFRDEEGLTVEQVFLQVNGDYLQAAVYKAPFDQGTLREINRWASENTGGMIPNILDEISDETVMYLINALAFDAQWQSIYYDHQVKDGTFTTESGEERAVELMHSQEHAYLDDKNATGFLKYYAGGTYAFAALLPNEGISLEDYISSLDGTKLLETLRNSQNITVEAAIPKFESETALELSDTLIALGMRDAFEADVADFTGIGTWERGNISISRVLHKCFLSVDEQGTRAGAATLVAVDAKSAQMGEPKVVCLDRPFVYMLIDCETSLPLLIGVVRDIGA